AGLLVATLMSGIFLILFGLARFGRLIEYIPLSVTHSAGAIAESNMTCDIWSICPFSAALSVKAAVAELISDAGVGD
ncbi:hypothetical protein FK513_29400, partial [Klebsiella pneumoniae]|nr:hypothetical protein [Klebsiella pneumoniae]